ncbi:exopolyphosphatase [Croceicoccus sp. YJ47]|uniref:Ppx/GppA phosphatase family protein n=1 Tax=Croceicoccus sp. YJ47 TaxID=2798724 RepID=UPI001920451F|nr:exopolyphosphatase [Croceicoccus sp. YJ47]QQN74837.1 exopolyphosphatase [Croceicoccus sp. YJ47]
MTRRSSLRSGWSRNGPRRAIVDIGSNTVRLVIYDGPLRVPRPLHNEKVTARLGRDLATTGRIADAAAEQALAALARFALLVEEMEVADVEVVATAAVRDAENGPEFLNAVRGLGFAPRLLSGEEEAEASAQGVLGAFPGATGMVADLGGGSLELVPVDGAAPQAGISLPLGTLRLPPLREKGDAKFGAKVAKMLKEAELSRIKGQTLYLVGGSFRAFGQYAMIRAQSPLEDAHGYIVDADEALSLARTLADSSVKALNDFGRISSSRRETLPDTAALLAVLCRELKPDTIRICAWGLREGLLFRRLGPETRSGDPLVTDVAAFTAERGGSPRLATMIAGWSAAVRKDGGYAGESLHLAAILLTLASRDIEPNLRRQHVLDWALRKRWMAILPAERAMLASALLAAIRAEPVPDDVAAMASERQLREGRIWGLAVRLCQRLGGASIGSLVASDLSIEDGTLVLTLNRRLLPLYGEGTAKDLANLADALRLKPEMRVGAVE